jgi:hypothetical protein
MHKGLQGFLATLIAGFSVLWLGTCLAQSLKDPAAIASATTSKAQTSTDPCEDQRNWREYRISAIDVKMVLNRFGDRDDDAFMYVLDEKKEKVEKWQNQSGCTSWDQPGEHEPCVSTGLRDDLVQPLVLRANLGQCLVIHFTNRLKVDKLLDPKDKSKPKDLLKKGRLGLKWPIDRADGRFITKAALQIDGLAYLVERAGKPVRAIDTLAAESLSEKSSSIR